MKHRERHPVPVDDCFGCKLLSIHFGADAMPNRRAAVRKVELTDRKWARDMAAYRRLRGDGLQPQGIDGCARLERDAVSAAQVESARPDPPFVQVDS